jgi:hypothetical protein
MDDKKKEKGEREVLQPLPVLSLIGCKSYAHFLSQTRPGGAIPLLESW